jgi:hypothetical protein
MHSFFFKESTILPLIYFIINNKEHVVLKALNDIIVSDEISEEDLDDLLSELRELSTLTDLEADLEMTLNKVLDKI